MTSYAYFSKGRGDIDIYVQNGSGPYWPSRHGFWAQIKPERPSMKRTKCDFTWRPGFCRGGVGHGLPDRKLFFDFHNPGLFLAVREAAGGKSDDDFISRVMNIPDR